MPSVMWSLQLVQQVGQTDFCLYSNCADCRLHCGSYCKCNRAIFSAVELLVIIAITRCAVCTVGLTVSATVQQVGQSECGTI